jgi:hypothetical protein
MLVLGEGVGRADADADTTTDADLLIQLGQGLGARQQADGVHRTVFHAQRASGLTVAGVDAAISVDIGGREVKSQGWGIHMPKYNRKGEKLSGSIEGRQQS